MTLTDAIEEVKRETIGDEFEAYEFYEVASTNVAALAIATILNAVVKGELIDRKVAHDLVGALNDACVDDSVHLWAKDRQAAILQIGKDGQHEV